MGEYTVQLPWHHELRSPKMGLAAVLTLAIGFPAAARADDWPQFRGPNRDGVWSETGILESFPGGGLTAVWRAPAGPGFSSPVVAQGRAYLFDAALSAPNARERVRCFEASSGKPLWSHSYGVHYPEWVFTEDNQSGPNATPIVRDGKLYALGQLGDLHCLDALTGDVLWKRDLARDYQVKEFSCTPSPLIEGDLLILSIGGKPEASVLALQKSSGAEAWKALDEGQTHSSPIVIDAGGKRQLIVWTQASVYSLDPATGKAYWRERLITVADYAVSTPIVHGSWLFAAGLMLKLDADKPAASVLWPDTRTVSRRILSNTSTAVVLGEHLYSARSSGELVCLEASTGKQVWEAKDVTDLKSGASIHLTPNGDSVLLYTDRGELIRARLGAKGYQEISRAKLLEPTYPFAGRKVAWPPPAYADRRIFARNDRELICASLAQKP
jgi:outer membrane protein assembly factor BamB